VLYAYTKLNQYTSAQRYCDQLLALADKSGKNGQDQGVIYLGAIRFFVASKQQQQARRYLAEYELYSKQNSNLRYASQAQFYWFKLDSMQGNYTSAIKHYQQFKQLEDSLSNETKNRQIASLEVLHETEQKEKNIQFKQQRINLLTRQSQLQDQQIQKDQLVRNVIIGGAILLLLLLAVIYNRYRLKQRSNQQLQAQQQKLQAQHKELYAQQGILQAQQKEINQKNEHLSQLLNEQDSLLVQKDTLIREKEGLLKEKDCLLSEQQRLLTEKEWLLKEIHHRVKNNLQVVMSLLNSQASSLEDEAALSAIQESQHRVQAMAFIHQKLYQSESVARIPMADYISEVVAYLHESYHLPQPIRLQLEVEPIELDVTQAVPLGLIINEAITNALKYAFPQGRSGTVRLSLHRLAARTYELTIADDGVGLPEGYQPGRSRSLGMKLLHGFSRQLGGKLTISSVPGLSISLVFAEEQLRSISTRVAYA
jgi:two-component sensor histidine kinase